MTTRLGPQCPECTHHHGGRTCAAFPDGIPDEIHYEGHQHNDPYPGDHGIQFQNLTPRQAELSARIQAIYAQIETIGIIGRDETAEQAATLERLREEFYRA